jgi:hypothetical protein
VAGELEEIFGDEMSPRKSYRVEVESQPTKDGTLGAGAFSTTARPHGEALLLARRGWPGLAPGHDSFLSCCHCGAQDPAIHPAGLRPPTYHDFGRLVEHGRLVWRDLPGSRASALSQEPEAGLLRRLAAAMVGLLPLQSQL